jgi:TorA maturation chaperone TorD
MVRAVAAAGALMADDPGDAGIPEEELFRAQLYALSAQLLRAPPEPHVLAALAGLEGDESDLGQALSALSRAAAAADAAAVSREYHDLFIGLGRGELVPYGSYYRTGFLNEKPLAELRDALRRLGVARAAEVKEPEDHIAALCEVMGGLVTGAYGAPQPLGVQRQLFEAHLAPWAGRFFTDLERANSARLYASIGRVGRIFMEIEATAFAIADGSPE